MMFCTSFFDCSALLHPYLFKYFQSCAEEHKEFHGEWWCIRLRNYAYIFINIFSSSIIDKERMDIWSLVMDSDRHSTFARRWCHFGGLVSANYTGIEFAFDSVELVMRLFTHQQNIYIKFSWNKISKCNIRYLIKCIYWWWFYRKAFAEFLTLFLLFILLNIPLHWKKIF